VSKKHKGKKRRSNKQINSIIVKMLELMAAFRLTGKKPK